MYLQSMIEKIINNGKYNFEGTLDDLKRCIKSFKVVKVIYQGEIQGMNLLEVHGKFKYHGVTYHVLVTKDWIRELLHIKFLGGNNV